VWAGENAAKLWCSNCASLLSLELRPALMHSENGALGYLDCVNCRVVDTTAALLLATCFECFASCRLPPFVANRTLEKTCEQCHNKLACRLPALTLTELTPAATVGRDREEEVDPIERDLQAFRRRVPERAITPGQPLPDLGKCKHFRKSRRWLRFSCCGKAFPCPTCHEQSGCPAAVCGVMASRMICGQCSREQNFGNGLCLFCAFNMVKSSSGQHWQGGEGGRDRATLSKKDRKKYAGANKTAAVKKVTGPKKKQ
jgi:hypothetical protein